MLIKMPNVLFCNVYECAYNDRDACHAMAITVDNSPEPMCDTFFRRDVKGGVQEFNGSVGACKNDRCMHNTSFECTANGIHVSKHQETPACDTFKIKP